MGAGELYDKVHRAIVQRESKWPQKAEHVLDMADMLVAYCSNERCKRVPVEGYRGSGSLIWRGEWKSTPYAAGMGRAYKLLGMRRGMRGMIKLPPNWKERLGEAGVDWETMGVIAGEELKWGRAWKQFMDFDSYRADRQREWNVLGVKCEWPCPVISWEARANSRRVRGVPGVPGVGEEVGVMKVGKVDMMSKIRKRVRMRVEEEG